MELNEDTGIIYPLLERGEASARTKSDLCSALGISPETLRHLVEDERRQGFPILSTMRSPGGYFRAADSTELQKFIGSMERRARNIFLASKAARQELKWMEKEESGQLKIEGMQNET